VENERGARSRDFAALLRHYRVSAGLSQAALAERAKMSSQGISALERGFRRTPQRGTLVLLAGALALDYEQRREFEAAAARSVLLGRGASVSIGPWPRAAIASLPFALTSFVGRERELDEVATLVRAHRLVTLTGAGGVGKTQTALHVATALSDADDGAVTFVGLASIGDASLVTTAIANALGVQEVPNHPLLETLVAFLKNKTVLLVLDNCEHVIAETATVADRLLRACPNLRILATSREPLRAAGERAYRLPSLDRDDAIALFADRARAAQAHFAVTDENEPIIRKICQQLSGIPLAIELAAARVTVLPVRTLAKAFEDRSQVLIGGERTAPPRQQTMRATIDWSFSLLTAPEQRLFERLSIFAGGCAIGAATAVCPGEDVAADDVLPLLSSLVTKSLVEVDVEGDEPRYRLLEPFREYAREKLKARGEQRVVAERHAFAYLGFAEHYAVTRGDEHYTIHYELGRSEVGNWRAAIQWALTERNDVLTGQRLAAELVCSWGEDAVFSDAKRWVPAALNLVDEQTPRDAIAKLKHAEAVVAMCRYDHHKVQLASALEAAAYYREVGDELRLMQTLDIAGGAFNDLGRGSEARPFLEEALQLARKLGIRRYIVIVLRNFAQLEMDERDFVAARALDVEALQYIKAADDQVQLECVLVHLGDLTFHEGHDAESAVRQVTDVLARGRYIYSPRHITVHARIILSEYLVALGRYKEAREYALEAVEAARDEHLDAHLARSLGRLAAIAILRPAEPMKGVQATVARVLGFVDALFTSLAYETERYVQSERVFSRLRDTLGADVFATLFAEGATMTEDEAVEAATAL
jgi:predicted ATPase/transcriptional regulator with XRE-family HTH domain